tara:strand:- start:30281 stop:31159 length:879 start_codon:yes stop_codon:yes gene_type:complete
MCIENIAIDGAGPTGMLCLGALRRSHQLGLWAREDIRTISSISSGSLFAVAVAIHADWDLIEDYFIKRPWHDTAGDLMCMFPFSSYKLCNVVLEPLLSSAGLSSETTLGELKTQTGIGLKIITTALLLGDAAKVVVLDHESNPDLKVIEACARSCALVPAFASIKTGQCDYVDGGFATGNSALLLCNDDNDYLRKTLHITYHHNWVTSDEANPHLYEMLIFALNLRIRQLYQPGNAAYTIVLGKSFLRCSWLDMISHVDLRHKMIATARKDTDSFVGRHLIDKLFKKRNSGL